MKTCSVRPAFLLPVLLILAVVVSACGSSHRGGGAEPLSCDDPCHGLPPATGAHLAHVQVLGVPSTSLSCVVCHGSGAATGSHPGHQDSTATLLGDTSYAAMHGALPSWFGSTWGGTAYYGTPSATGDGAGGFDCANLRCHGGGTVGWGEQADSPYFNRVCLDCHDITPAEFALPGEAAPRRACDAAANYAGPVSGWGRGGHGDTAINDPQWFRDSADGSSIPLSCVRCHDEGAPHFPASSDNPYRVWRIALQNGLPGADSRESRITNLCTQTDCHPKVLGDGSYAFLTALKHPNDNWPILSPPNIRSVVVTADAAPLQNESSIASTADPGYDPVGIAKTVGLHIDRFVDHWAWWNPSSPATAKTSDDRPFLPLGDSLAMASGGVYDNGPSLVVTCVTCHNPHGTDLVVAGEVPGSFATQAMVPNNKMLRLRDSDTELCDACH